VTSPRKRKLPRLPPPWVRRADWSLKDGYPEFSFPHLRGNPHAEASAVERLHDWADLNAPAMIQWMGKVDRHRMLAPTCMCPQCAAEREGRA
jgi:hypothetical protein